MERLNTTKKVIDLIYGSPLFLPKSQLDFFVEIYTIILKFTWEGKEYTMVKT
jgi:hypothetical protein